MRCDKLAPNTAVPHSATTASTMPKRVLPTGTAAPPFRLSRALRTPIIALGGTPIDAKCATAIDGREVSARSSERNVRAARSAGHSPRAHATATVASAPNKRTGVSKTTPVEVSAVHASPRGASGDNAVANTKAPPAPTSPTIKFRSMPRAKSCRRAAPRDTIVGKPACRTGRTEAHLQKGIRPHWLRFQPRGGRPSDLWVWVARHRGRGYPPRLATSSTREHG